MTEGHMNIPEKETFSFFDELGQRTKFYRGLIPGLMICDILAMDDVFNRTRRERRSLY